MAGGITQTEYWNGEVGTRWARNQAVLDTMFVPLTEALFARLPLRHGASVLDIGCGAGATTLEAARRVGAGGRVTGADISAPAGRRAGPRGGGGARRRPGPVHRGRRRDGRSRPVRSGALAIRRDVFPDSARAFANVRRMLAPGGRLTFLCWRTLPENQWVSVPREAVLPLLAEIPPPPQPDTPGPFRFADADPMVALLRGAGFADVTCDAVDRDIVLGQGETDAAAVAAATHVSLNLGPSSHLVREAAPDLRARAEAAVSEALRRYTKDGSVRLRAACWLVQAG
ncbi:class I SAM-dependent methyltransferase [Methylobacterium phyllosphaerae]